MRALALVSALALACQLDLLLCPFAAVFALPCPGCGLTRATALLLRGELSAALALHPLAPLLAPLAAGATWWFLLDYVRGPGTPPRAISRTAEQLRVACSGLLLALVFGVWIARFFGSFSGPAPVGHAGGDGRPELAGK